MKKPLNQTNNNINLFKKIPPMKENKPKEKICKICGGKSIFFDVVDFNKYCGQEERYISDISGIEIPYYRCDSCEFIFTDIFDKWKPNEFRKYIYNDEYILVDPEYLEIRPKYTSENMVKLIPEKRDIRILDYGAGSGGFSHEMRGKGFENIQNYDPFSSPKLPAGRFDLVCFFEVIEHVCDPLGAIKSVFDKKTYRNKGGVLITQTVQPENILDIRGNWWYLGPRNGHISLFSEKTFSVICDILSIKFVKIRCGYYFFYREDLNLPNWLNF